MPVKFLPSARRASFGRFYNEPDEHDVSRCFYLYEDDLRLINKQKNPGSRLGFALQLCTVRFLGTFLDDATDVPPSLIKLVAQNLGIIDPNQCLAGYAFSQRQRYHARIIANLYGYETFNVMPHILTFLRWLFYRAWYTNERPIQLFDQAVSWLYVRKILLPGSSVLERLIARCRERAEARIIRKLSSCVSSQQQAFLFQLLNSSTPGYRSEFDKLRTPPTRVSARALTEAVARVKGTRGLFLDTIDLSSLPQARVRVLAQYALTCRAQALERMPKRKRAALLVAALKMLQATSQDDVLDIFDRLISKFFKQAKRYGEEERLRTTKVFDQAVVILAQAVWTLLDANVADEQVREAVYTEVPRSTLIQAAYTVKDMARPYDNNYYEHLKRSYSQVRQFLPTFLQTIQFDCTEAGREVMEAVKYLGSLEVKTKQKLIEAPCETIPKAWQQLLFCEDQSVNRCYYTYAILQQLQAALARRDIFAVPSERWGDPRAKLIQGNEWQVKQPEILRSLEKSLDPQKEISCLNDHLHDAFQKANEHLRSDTSSFRINALQGKEVLSLSPLAENPEPESLIALREEVTNLIPEIDLPEILLEIDVRTGFTREFTHISEAKSRSRDFSISVCAVLLAEACNIGIRPFIREDVPALKRGRLEWIQQNYIRPETIVAANAKLVEAQSQIPLVAQWGQGEVASADGMRFVVPVNTVHGDYNSKYFGKNKGITYYNFVSDQYTGFHATVVPGTLRDSIFILDGLLEHQTSLDPQELMTDTAGYSHLVFGLFWLLGYRFSPRLADIGEATFWRIDDEDIGAFRTIARQKINTRIIVQNWEDMLRIAGSLKLGRVSASDIIRAFNAGDKPSTLARAIAELGKIPKTIHLLTYLTDETFRRRVLVQLNRQEARHSLGRTLCIGKKGALYEKYREGQEEQLGCLGLVMNVIALWNTLYIEKALQRLNEKGLVIKDEDIARLSPLIHEHINVLGRYSFFLDERVKRGDFRPLRDEYG